MSTTLFCLLNNLTASRHYCRLLLGTSHPDGLPVRRTDDASNAKPKRQPVNQLAAPRLEKQLILSSNLISSLSRLLSHLHERLCLKSYFYCRQREREKGLNIKNWIQVRHRHIADATLRYPALRCSYIRRPGIRLRLERTQARVQAQYIGLKHVGLIREHRHCSASSFDDSRQQEHERGSHGDTPFLLFGGSVQSSIGHDAGRRKSLEAKRNNR